MTKLDELVQCIQNPHVYVQMHNYPDQDAIASAMGLQYLLNTRGKTVTIVYHGIIDKENTLLMIDLLHIELLRVEDINFTPDDEIIIVDGQKGSINMHNLTAKAIACVDHHKKQNTDFYSFYDIRSNVGSCASIVTSYFIENNIEMPVNVATALLYGQRIDTSHLTRGATLFDVDTFYYLFKIANHAQLRKFETSSMNINDLSRYHNAIANLKIYKSIVISNVGKDCSEAMIGTISDFLLALSEIQFSLLYSFRAGGIKFSIRSSVENINISDIIQEALRGYGDGGGHMDMAAGFAPNINSEAHALEIAAIIEQRVISLIEKNLNV